MKKTITIRIPDHLHRAVKATSAEEGISMSEYIVDAVKARMSRVAGGVVLADKKEK